MLDKVLNQVSVEDLYRSLKMTEKSKRKEKSSDSEASRGNESGESSSSSTRRSKKIDEDYEEYVDNSVTSLIRTRDRLEVNRKMQQRLKLHERLIRKY